MIKQSLALFHLIGVSRSSGEQNRNLFTEGFLLVFSWLSLRKVFSVVIKIILHLFFHKAIVRQGSCSNRWQLSFVLPYGSIHSSDVYCLVNYLLFVLILQIELIFFMLTVQNFLTHFTIWRRVNRYESIFCTYAFNNPADIVLQFVTKKPFITRTALFSIDFRCLLIFIVRILK